MFAVFCDLTSDGFANRVLEAYTWNEEDCFILINPRDYAEISRSAGTNALVYRGKLLGFKI